MDNEQYTIPGMTGVDVSLPIAGPGSRSYAFIIDWHIRVLVALAWFVAALLTVSGSLRMPARSAIGVTVGVAVVPFLIYFLYHPVVELLMQGQSPGKRMARVRVVTVHGGTPGIGAVLIRNIFRLIDSLPMLYVVGLTSTFLSAQRVRIGDMAAGTLLVIDERVPGRYLDVELARSEVDFATRDLAEQILERWTALEVDKRDAIARSLLKKAQGSNENPDLLDDESLRMRLAAIAGRS
jgi:uncharacterized RDD family membrane protein YckC